MHQTSTSIQNTPEWISLYEAHVLYMKELVLVSQSFDVYRVIGINVKQIHGPGKEFVAFSSLLAQHKFVTGIESLFERTDDGAGLCSIRGLLALAERVPLSNAAAHAEFVEKYGVNASANWLVDVETVLAKERPMVKECLSLTSKLRNNRVAHLAQPTVANQAQMMPSLDTSEKILSFAYDFYCFIARGFLYSQGAEIPETAGYSLLEMLKKRFSIENVVWDFPAENSSHRISDNCSR